ncbi:MAG: dihydropteridine reductase [Clostridia bacterium]|nr:dihydropteridine reductase [Clostridia bacterium]
MLEEVNKIKSHYAEKQETKFEKLKRLDRQVKKPAKIFAYIFGIIGTLIFGTGMCLAMKVIGNIMAIGIVIGVFGIFMLISNNFLYKIILSGRKKRYSSEILAVADEIIKQNSLN